MHARLELPKATCEAGYTEFDLKAILADDAHYEHLMYWMRGQTMALCDGRKYNYDTGSYEPACDGVAHGPVVYRWDLERFLEGRPIID